jgi:hypothetical protein
MANTLTGLIPDLYAALDKVSREMVGYIPAVGASLSGTAAAVDEAVRVPIAPTSASIDVTPSMVLTDPADQTIGYVDVKITKSKSVPFAFVGEEQRGLNNGPGHLNIQAKMIAQAMRTLVNEVEADVSSDAYLGASRAYGVAGTTPFASTLKDTAQIKKVLKDNGAPMGDLQLVLDTTAGANVLGLTQLTNVNQSGDSDLLRQGLLTSQPVHGFSLRETGQGVAHTKGTGAAYVTDTAGYAIGATSITLTTGTGTVLAGDTVTFAGDDNIYVVDTGIAAPGTIVLAAPGLRQALPASAVALTVGDSYTANVAFDRDAIQLVTRAPAMPAEGDARMDSMVIQDPISGLAFEVSVWGGNRKVRYEVSLAWGQKVIKPEHIGLLLG